MLIGVISDTHGTVSLNALEALKGVQTIVHAGDIGGPDVITQLEQIAPVIAVRGNTDGTWAQNLPHAEMISLGGRSFYILHDLITLDLEPGPAGIEVVISGHTHQSEIKSIKSVLYFNPGSASVRRYERPLSVGRIQISAKGIKAKIIHIDG